MNLDTSMAALEQGFQNPDVALRKITLASDDMPKFKLRRTYEATEYRVWMITIGELGQQPTAYFVDHSVNKVIKKALAWRGVPTKTRKKSAQAAAAGQAPA